MSRIVPNDIRKGDVVTTMDKMRLVVADNRKGFRRRVSTSLTVSGGRDTYVFDWETVNDVTGQTFDVALPKAYVMAHGKIADSGVDPGRLNGTAMVDGVESFAWPKNPSIKLGWNGERTVEGTEFITDGHLLFKVASMSATNLARLKNRQHEYNTTPVPESGVWDVWRQSATLRSQIPVTVDDSVEPIEKDDYFGKERYRYVWLQALHKPNADDWRIAVDYEKFRFANKITGATNWRAILTPDAEKIDRSVAIVGFNRDGCACYILMPVRVS